MKKTLVLLSFCISVSCFGNDILVRLFSQHTLTQSWVTTHNGHYFLVATDENFNEIDTVLDLFSDQPIRTLFIKQMGRLVEVQCNGKNLGSYSGLLLKSAATKAHFIIKGKGAERIYEGNLKFRATNNQLLIINQVELESYVAGVVESEGGHNVELEYFKAQAVLARTWVLKNMRKHLSEGYNVKDDVSSQAYNSKAYYTNYKQILAAVEATKDTVLVDKNGALVFGAFYSNSGGQTSNSEDIWSQKIDYLRSVQDTFSLKGEHATWQKEVNKEDFVAYFAAQLGESPNNPELRKKVFSIHMGQREPWFYFNNKKVKMRNVRTQFRLRSSFFSVEESAKILVLKGKGFGHGVGLSQEGAMYMAAHGYNYKKILQFYFQGVSLKKLSEL